MQLLKPQAARAATAQHKDTFSIVLSSRELGASALAPSEQASRPTRFVRTLRRSLTSMLASNRTESRARARSRLRAKPALDAADLRSVPAVPYRTGAAASESRKRLIQRPTRAQSSGSK
jgi:hypothetical protein